MLVLLVLPLVHLSRIDSQGSIAQPVGDSIQHEIYRTIVRSILTDVTLLEKMAE